MMVWMLQCLSQKKLGLLCKSCRLKAFTGDRIDLAIKPTMWRVGQNGGEKGLQFVLILSAEL